MELASRVGKPRMRGSKACAGACAIVVAIIVTLVVLALTVFRPRHPVIVTNAVRLLGIQVGLNATHQLGANINVTLLLDVSVSNPNHATFVYADGGTAELYYRGGLVGGAAIPPGETGPEETMRMNLTMSLMAERMVADADVYLDVLARSLPLTTSLRIAGKVVVLRFFKHRAAVSAACDVAVDVVGRLLFNKSCKYKTTF